MKRKDHKTILNNVVQHAADIMEAKAETLEDSAEYTTDPKLALKYKKDAADIRISVERMRERDGCWS